MGRTVFKSLKGKTLKLQMVYDLRESCAQLTNIHVLIANFSF